MRYHGLCAWLALLFVLAPLPGIGAEAKPVSIAPGPLSKALSDFARAMDIEIILDPSLTGGKSSEGVSGTVTIAEGLRRLLAGSGLDFELQGRSVSLRRAEPPPVKTSRIEAADPDENDTIIVTGTRLRGVKASESSTPIEIVGGEILAATGQNTLFDALKDVVPSFTSVSGTDYGLFARSARFRGLPAGETLVLINGKRRHNSAYVQTGNEEDIDSNAVDLDLIPIGLVDHVEILLDGAAAQYGSDAIASVINVILKSSDFGSIATATGGVTSRGDGAQAEATSTVGFSLPHNGFLTATADYVHHDFSLRDQGIPRAYGASLSFGKNGTSKLYNHFYGDPLSDMSKLGYNFAMPLAIGALDTEIYGFATVDYRATQGWENYRAPSVAPRLYPQGFYPRETLREWDFAVTEGVRGSWAGWRWDLSNTFGRDDFRQGIFDTVNTGFYALNGSSPSSANTGSLISAQSTTNLDFARPFRSDWWRAPINLAIGFEHRYETYQEIAGDPISYIDGGTAAFAGFTPQAASNSSRSVGSVYVDLSTEILPAWQLDVTGRFEDYSDVAANKNGRLSTRYDATSWLALRGTLNNGFHAPTLAQQHFAIANVNPSPTGGQGQIYSLLLPTDSAGAKLLGALPLRPETDNDATIGLVAKLSDNLHASLDVYEIYLNDRIVQVGPVLNKVTGPGVPLVLQAVSAQGFMVPPASSAQTLFYTNLANTRTRGIDLSADYKMDLGADGILVWTLAGNQNDINVTRLNAPPPQLAAAGLTTVNAQGIAELTKSNPQNKASLAADLSSDPWEFTLRETRWGTSIFVQGIGNPVFFPHIRVQSAYLTDFSIAYELGQSVKLTIGGTNAFDRMPPYTPAAFRSIRNGPAYVISAPYGDQGAYFYSRATLAF